MSDDGVKAEVDDVAEAIIEKSDEVVAGAGELAEQVQEYPLYRALVTGGLISYGVVQLLLAFLVVQVVRGAGVDASESGSIAMIAAAPFGFVLLLVVALGMAALALWQVLLALFGYGYLDGFDLLRRKLASLGRAVLYLALGAAVVRTLWGVREDSNEATRASSAALLDQWYGPALLVLLGTAIVVVGLAFVRRGILRTFAVHDLQGSVPRWAIWLGSVGWVAKGLTQAAAGVLLWLAVWAHDPAQAGGLDLALKGLSGQPYGRVLLLAVAAGIAAFGLYCLLWAFNARHDVSKD